MQHIQGQNRNQILLFTSCIDELVTEENTVRVIDIFVDSLSLQDLGFTMNAPEGRPGYHPADLLKLYIYGYMNRMRSSRQLDREMEQSGIHEHQKKQLD